MTPLRLLPVGIIASFLWSPPAAAQGTAADYARANGLRKKYQALALHVPERTHWVEKSDRFWYRRSVDGGHEFVLVNASTLARQPAFDHARLAAGLSKADGESHTAVDLPFGTFTFEDHEKSIQFAAAGETWRCDLAEYVCTAQDRRGRDAWAAGPGRSRAGSDEPRTSPDGKWEAFIQNYNVAIREPGSKTPILLSTDGSEGNFYELRSMQWSPDSTKLAAYRIRPGYHREVHYIESSPEDQLQPEYSTRRYAKPGDVLDLQQPVLFHVAPAKEIPLDNALFPNAYELSRLAWRKDSSALTFEYNQRGHQVYRIIEANAETGATRAVVDEQARTFFCYSGKKFREDIDDGREIVWMSERDGWNHLYLYDGRTGQVKNQITKGPWVVRDVVKVDPEKRQIWFAASGMYPGKDPYFVNDYRINFDGSGLTRLTQADANHSSAFSDDMQFYVDTYSRVDMAPVSELRRTADGSLVEEVDRGDIGQLVEAGWTPPEVFVAKGRDGTTDIWGVIYRPTTFDASKKYPVIENIYAGPQSSFVPKSFGAYNSMQALAELGFIVVQIDGMGTSNRSKAFHDVAWKDLKDAGFPDRILWHKAVAAKYPYYDITRVGIYGTSAGGQSSLGALLFHPEFYKVAVSASGCHDNRMDKIWWNEQWMGWPIGPQYAESSNVDNAYRLQGDVLLIVGEMDTNVDPSSTMQVVNQLIKHDKNFDLLVIPGSNHTSGGEYGEHKRRDFFVKHLLGVDPPRWTPTESTTTSQ